MNAQQSTETLTGTKWAVDTAHSSIYFTSRHMLISKVKGHFDKFDASYTSADNDLESLEAKASIQVDSITTGVQGRDEHLKSPDFFNAAEYPEITFESTGFKKVKEGEYKLNGRLTIRDKTKPIELDVSFGGIIKDPYGNDRAGFELRGTINRFDYDLKWNQLLESGGAVVSKDINVFADVEFIKK